jgi:quercetin dioxygenase-like cupin family protein
MDVTAVSPRDAVSPRGTPAGTWPRHVPRSVAVALCAAGLFLLPTAAQATPPTGVSGTVLATGTMADRFELETHGRTEFVVQQITIQPGGSTGWHYHPGTVLAVVRTGAITRVDSHCRAVTYSAGESLVEPGGAHHVHLGRNLGTEPVELYLTYLDPVGSALAVDAADPGCGDSGGTPPSRSAP